MLRIFSLTRPRGARCRVTQNLSRFHPRLESLEGRAMPNAALLAPPAAGTALVARPTPTQSATSLLPITVNSVDFVGVTNNALQLVANATTAAGRTLQIPLTLTNTTPGAATPILDLHVGEIHLNLLGLKVDTSEICLKIQAQPGPGNLLGNLLSDVAHLLDQGLNLQQILDTLTATQEETLTTGLGGLVNGAFGAAGSTTNAATGGASVTSMGSTRILHLSLGPVDLNLLGLEVHLDNCHNGPITIDITAQSGPGNLLGNLLGSLAHLLDHHPNQNALLNHLEHIAGVLRGLV
jgi:hypothetical protein